MLKKTNPYRAGDRVAVWVEVVTTPGHGLAVQFGDSQAGFVVPIRNVDVVEHHRAIREGDKVTAPGFTPGEHGVVKFLLDAGGVVQPRAVQREATFACVYVDGAPPRIMATDQLTRLDD